MEQDKFYRFTDTVRSRFRNGTGSHSTNFVPVSELSGPVHPIPVPLPAIVVAKKVYRNCPIMFPNRVTYVELLKVDMVSFDIVMGMDWMHAFFASIDN